LYKQPVGTYYIASTLLFNTHSCYNGNVTNQYFAGEADMLLKLSGQATQGAGPASTGLGSRVARVQQHTKAAVGARAVNC
jgi:hypothetical protein